MDRKTFRDPQLQANFERDGFVVVPLLDSDGVDASQRLFEELHPSQPEGFFATQFSADRNHKAEVDRGIQQIQTAAVDKFLDRYRPLVANFVVKAPGEASEMTTHQDWSFVDEQHWATVNVWCPLIDVDLHNGALCLVAGSHRILPTIRGTGLPSPTMGLDLDYATLACPRLRAGEAIIYDHRLIHGSPPNLGEGPRVATAFNWLPDEAPALHYLRRPEASAVEVYEIPPGFFANFTYGDKDLPQGSRLVHTIEDYEFPSFTPALLERSGLLAEAAVPAAPAGE